MTRRSAALIVACGMWATAQDTAPSLKSEFLRNYDDTTKKIISLAEAIPADKYSWRPAEGVRSVSEVFVHIAGANFMIPTTVGVKPPAGVDRNAEKTVTDKAKVVEMLRQSVEHARGAIGSALEGDPNRPTKVFGRDSSYGGASLLMISHLHEHLGQTIAYARSVGVAPPWSRGRGE